MYSTRFLRSEPKSKIYDGAAFCCAVSFSVASLAENSLSLRSLRSGAQFFARRSFHFPTAPLIVRFSFFLPLGFRKLFFFASLKFLAYGGRQNFFACRRFPMKVLWEAVRANFMRGLPAVSVSQKSLSFANYIRAALRFVPQPGYLAKISYGAKNFAPYDIFTCT